MKTVVFQSHRATGLPAWLTQLMGFTKQWAISRGYDYQFLGDEILETVPEWYRKRAAGFMTVMTDLARVQRARLLLNSGYERAVWIDADVLICDPDLFSIDIDSPHAFCRELWLRPSPRGITAVRQVNNCVSVYKKETPLLDVQEQACLRLVGDPEVQLRPNTVGTEFLTKLNKSEALPLLSHVACLSPPVTLDLARGKGPYLTAHRRTIGLPVYAANFCASKMGQFSPDRRLQPGLQLDETAFNAAISRLLATKGQLLSPAPEKSRAGFANPPQQTPADTGIRGTRSTVSVTGHDLRVAVITAVYKPRMDWLTQCCDSVRAQTHPCTHFLVSDGSGPNPLKDFEGQYIELHHNHADWGDTPRAVGAVSAFAQGFDAVVWLDADNWFQPDHVHSLVELHRATASPVCVSARNLRTLDDVLLGRCVECDGINFIDANCYLMSRSAWNASVQWGRIPTRFHVVGDTWFWLKLKRMGYRPAFSNRATVEYRTSYPPHYQRFQKTVPAGCKPISQMNANLKLLQELRSLRPRTASTLVQAGNAAFD